MVERPAGGKDDFSESLSHRVASICDSPVSGVTRRLSIWRFLSPSNRLHVFYVSFHYSSYIVPVICYVVMFLFYCHCKAFLSA